MRRRGLLALSVLLTLAATTPGAAPGRPRFPSCLPPLGPLHRAPRPAPPEAGIGQGALRYLGNYPYNCRVEWSVDVQGVAHDASHWFFTQKGRLWRFPVAHDLGVAEYGPFRDRTVADVGIPAELVMAGYNHFGDLDYHAGVLVVPMEGAVPAIVALFSAADLRYLGHLQLPDQRGAGWIAVRPSDGRLFSSDSYLRGRRGLLSYQVDWTLLASGTLPRSPAEIPPAQREVAVRHPEAVFPLLDESGAAIDLHSMQGGEFAGDDRLFTVNGFCEGPITDAGLMALTLEHGVARRTLHSTTQAGPLAFQFGPGRKGLFGCREEPEGVTVWDLDDGSAPHIGGQLHVLMLNNALWDYGAVYFKHYAMP